MVEKDYDLNNIIFIHSAGGKNMVKKRLALLMAAVMTLTSVYPGGAVFAEEDVVPETAIEAVAEDVAEAEPAVEAASSSW